MIEVVSSLYWKIALWNAWKVGSMVSQRRSDKQLKKSPGKASLFLSFLV
jgi:hypothetical protein